MYKKKFLIVTASIGSGHNKAAEALVNEIKIKHPDAEIHMVDFMSTKTAYLNGFLKEAYLKILDFVPDVYDFFYNLTAGKSKGISVKSLLALTMKSNMEALIKQYQADVVICTHPFPCAAAAYLKKTKQVNIILVGVITDFTIHQLWVYNEVDLYFVANRKIREALAKRDVALDKIHDTGIPIDLSFGVQYDKEELLRKFNLKSDLPVILIMGGGLGLGGVKFALNHLETLKKSIQILVVAGVNSDLWSDLKEIAKNSKHIVEVWGFSNNVKELMAVSTFIISKPGALTISEALAMELPMLLHEPIPGQEKENAAYVESIGAAIWIKDNQKLTEIVESVLYDSAKLLKMKVKAREYKRPDAARDIVLVLDEYLRMSFEHTVIGL
ncbi:MGDG synthase family glycosyltransferase [Propionispira raffinosivorans]|uniref:MGDG synthase family glycosyltransferase n=1 Tax=Propionispira raffinosivorans TaxID=86959 RepID=UPI0003659793|nr:glycosyltransferase [Propionispira raffinosivorans]